ncbi:MAG: 50S ribosomal protein L3, partial [Candidatus Aenigmarchaeota archaeon]|nr:50S ribosomal protein L3 [Candidatus Aenigmarchaeota archaeon]
ETPGLLGFAGYKAGMTSISYVDDSASPSKGLEISSAATVLEVPPITVYGLRAYAKGYMGKQTLCDVVTDDAKILKTLGFVKRPDGTKRIEAKLEELANVTLLVFTNPAFTGIGAKKPVRMELAVGGKSLKEKYEYCKSVLGTQLRFSDIFKDGEYVDSIAVTKGKGWQGPVKRFGVRQQRRKSTGKRRHVGTLGPWKPSKVMYTAPQAGQMGYHRRTEYNKRILKIGSKPEEIVPKGGFPHYGVVKNDYVVLRGSIAGPAKRLVKLRKALRKQDAPKKPEVKFISLRSKQGVRSR